MNHLAGFLLVSDPLCLLPVPVPATPPSFRELAHRLVFSVQQYTGTLFMLYIIHVYMYISLIF